MALARELGIPEVLVPARPGLTNALGCLVADLRQDRVNSLNRPLDGLDMAEARAVLEAQRDDALDELVVAPAVGDQIGDRDHPQAVLEAVGREVGHARQAGGRVDLQQDPMEKSDLSQSHPDVVTQLRQKLTAWHATLPAQPTGDVFSQERAQ